MKSFPWQLLLDWYSENGRHDFPWRQYAQHTQNNYTVWLAEILLQQTQADRVVWFYTKMLEKYPTVHDLARSSYAEFFPYYQWLGYYSRARNLLKTAKIISEEYSGIFPRDKSLLKKLPGVGEYTARAILAFGYWEPLLAWDTNLETIFSRYYKWAKNIKLTENEKNTIERDFQDFIEKYVSWAPIFACESSTQNTNNELNGVWGEKLSESDENNKKDEQSGTSFSLPNSFGTFSTKSTWDIIRNINNGLMDWARMMEPKNSSLFNRDTYIFTGSEFYMSNWDNEIIEKKISVSFPTPDAQVVVILHQDHRIYYSLSMSEYTPFILAPSLDRDTRRYVQDYFRETYSLELSVRPVHRKWITTDGKPYIAVNAQIQAGKYEFQEYSKTDTKIILSRLDWE